MQDPDWLDRANIEQFEQELFMAHYPATTDAARNVMTETEIVRSVLIKKSHGDEDCGHDYGDNLCTLESEFGLTS